jgi:hypothetical protein
MIGRPARRLQPLAPYPLSSLDGQDDRDHHSNTDRPQPSRESLPTRGRSRGDGESDNITRDPLTDDEAARP